MRPHYLRDESREPVTQHGDPRSSGTPLAARVLTLLVAVTAAAPFTLSGPVLFGLSVMALIYVLLSARVTLPHWTIVAFICWCAVTLAWSVTPGESVNGLLILAVATPALWGLVALLTKEQVYRALAAAMKLLLVLSVMLYIAVPGEGREQAAYHHGAFNGVFVQRNAAAFALATALLLFVFMAASPYFPRRGRSVAWAMGTLAALLATESSTGLAVAFVSCTALLTVMRMHRWGRSVRQLVGLLLLSVTALAVIGTLRDLAWLSRLLGRDDTLTGRTVIWSAIEPYIQARPWTGYGWAALWTPDSLITRAMWSEAGFRFPHAHNAYIDAVAQVGGVGLILLLCACVAVLINGGRRFLTGHGDLWVVWPLMIVAFLLLYGISESSFVSYLGLDLLVIASALLHAVGTARRGPMAAGRLAQRRPGPPPPHEGSHDPNVPPCGGTLVRSSGGPLAFGPGDSTKRAIDTVPPPRRLDPDARK